MTRQDVPPGRPLAAAPDPVDEPEAVRPSAAARMGRAGRILLAPLALVAAAVAGLVYVVLLPIGGIATIASAVAQASWAFLRELAGGARPRAAHRS